MVEGDTPDKVVEEDDKVKDEMLDTDMDMDMDMDMDIEENNGSDSGPSTRHISKSPKRETLDDLFKHNDAAEPEIKNGIGYSNGSTSTHTSTSASRSNSNQNSGRASPTSVIGEEDLKPRTHKSKKSKSTSHSTIPKINNGPLLIDDLPIAWDEAHETFDSLDKCHYESKNLGLSREQDEMMVCDCIYDKNDPDADPCGPESDCINRALFIECLAGECRAGKHCRNQQFARRQYANVEVVLTEKKGFGLRAGSSIPANTLIYEYIGEVVAERTFRKRMQQYADEGIRHFYFMMLQKEEYIDATKKGGIGRFANHSCNPNSEVQKWVVGRRLRMGIFTKRDVIKGEEITFNYNVDRYGHDAQICYCGEPNCVGTIGGKTQTDVSLSTMNDLFLDALGISDEVEAFGMKGSKKKKSRQLDADFIPTLRPIEEPEVQKVAAAMRQSMENKTMMSRLLQRIKMSEDPAIQRQLMRMHGFSLMSMVLAELAADRDIVLLALESMNQWKLQNRNKIEDSNIEEPIKDLQTSSDDEISKLAKQLLEYWSTLELSYKIPRVNKIASLDAEDEAGTTTIAEAASNSTSTPRRPDAWENNVQIQLDVAPVRPRIPIPSFHRPRPPRPPPLVSKPSLTTAQSSDRLKLDAIIALAQQNLQSAPFIPAPSESPAAESSRSGSMIVEEEDRRKRQKRSHYSSLDLKEDEETKKEKRMTKLVGEVVVRSMSKYKEQMEHDTFKRYAKECTQILVEKEKRGNTYASSRHSSLSDDKKAKMKSFTKEYTHKVLKRLKEKGKLIRPTLTSSSKPSPASNATVIITPSEKEESGNQVELMDDIFGKDHDDDMEGNETPISEKPSMTKSGDDGNPTIEEIQTAPASIRKSNGGGYTVERLDLSSLGKVNGLHHPQNDNLQETSEYTPTRTISDRGGDGISPDR
ncbi:uncharacterized protein IL334_007005 [Kwoniella shivajii]|uniref:Histone-lysine N-methyltransferase, H3 lysine-36 specific n=1 Tax=Kwoniella shivajii TaxID=564305 RepID=A0ABZ1D7J5_9TREE|nr:hypothetical protein IL334_007005 [Kwoniella shivajii]